ncbi:MAG: hypothetical protein EOM29_09200 [Bacteroidia bacterium]|nr:hypothetical protein [Bacteroidia bacterium]
MDSWYGYTDEVRDNPKRVFNDLSARRELSDDLDAIARDMTIQTVLCGTKYAPSEEEAEKWIRRKMMSLGNEWHKLHLQVKKLKPNNQLRLQFNTEKPIWESTTEKVSL